MVDLEETDYIRRNVPDNVGILIDVAHLKVSAETLKFDKIDYLSKMKPFIHAYHLSDNDGTSDSNQPFTPNSWFWPYINRALNYYTIEVYTEDLSLLSSQVQLAVSMIN